MRKGCWLPNEVFLTGWGYSRAEMAAEGYTEGLSTDVDRILFIVTHAKRITLRPRSAMHESAEVKPSCILASNC
jgi:hypothetical protein